MKPALDERHGTISTKATRGEWADGHCSNSACTLGKGHAGLCSHMLPTRARRQSGYRLETVEEVTEPEDSLEDTEAEAVEADEQEIDALLASAWTVQTPQWLSQPGMVNETCMAYESCVDAYSAVVNVTDIGMHAPPVQRKAKLVKPHAPPKTPAFDLSKPLPKNLKEAMAQVDNWNAEYGYKYAVERECGAWIAQGVLESTKPGDCLDDLTALNLGMQFSVKTDKKRRFKRAKLRLYVAAHERIVKQGEHYFENFSQTVGWGRLRQCCAQACEEGFVGCKQWDTCAAFLYAKNEPGTVVLIKLSEELAKALNVTPFCWCVKAAYGLPSAPAQFAKFVRDIQVNNCGAVPSKHDEAVFIIRRGDKYVMICTWVDDFCVLYNCQKLYEETRDAYFDKVDGEEGDLDFMLGVNFEVDVELQRIKLHATTAIEKIAAKYGKPQRESKVPMREEDAELVHVELPEVDSVEWLDLREQAGIYRSLVPSILYLATTCRPDICFAVGILCRCLDNPSARHIEAMWILLSYLVGTMKFWRCL